MVYVALHPVRAGLAVSLEDYRLATIAERVDELKRRIAEGEFAGEAAAARERLRSVRLVAAMPCDPGAELRAKPMLQNGAPNPWFGGRVPSIIEGSSLAAYLHDTDAQGREAAVGKAGSIPESTPPVLAMLDAELAACVAEETRTSPLMRTARAIVAQIDGAHPSGELQHLGQLQRERGVGREACAEDEEAVRAGDRCPGGRRRCVSGRRRGRRACGSHVAGVSSAEQIEERKTAPAMPAAMPCAERAFARRRAPKCAPRDAISRQNHAV